MKSLTVLLADIAIVNRRNNDWNNVLCIGHLPDRFYNKIQRMKFTHAVTNVDYNDHETEEDAPSYSNTIVIDCHNMTHFEMSVKKILKNPYWHPHANIIVYYREKDNMLDVAKIFFILWFYKACNIVIAQFDRDDNSFFVHNFSPFISEKYTLQRHFGCWKVKYLGSPVRSFKTSFECEETCDNVTLHSAYRANNLGTCLGIDTLKLSFFERQHIKQVNLFEDKGSNLHGYTLRTYTVEVPPFMMIDEHENGTFTIGGRDGSIWNLLSKLMNFSIDLSPSVDDMKKPFNFELTIQQVFSYTLRKGDLYLIPIYQFDIPVIQVDNTFPVKDSGVCFAAHRAKFSKITYDINLFFENYVFLLQFFFCFLSVWFTFVLFSAIERRELRFDQIGKDYLNCLRNILLISLYKPPQLWSFRVFLTISIWSFFILSFASQAAIISFFTALKRGKEVNTFEDIIEKGYPIEGMASPDVVLPDTEEKFQKINSKIVPILDIYGCIQRMNNETHLFCLIDCAIGRYLERNLLNEYGEQYLHIPKDRIHSYYLNIIFPKHSVLTERYNKYMMIFIEAGLVHKWEQYKFNQIKTEGIVKPLNMQDFKEYKDQKRIHSDPLSSSLDKIIKKTL
ncbi:uncharacterized protein LOC114251311 [Bombyx mandarina]|uniref:Uncharacterized protein LOC114251311 n=1 Tax=Bombyx mandarina TaxID=7092 RepID=A0A6J2KK59_BOMMA|nr:uncharacterized protein LOC114251311 [Bombyx mandarina]